jgi:hypothetical protein
MDYRVRAIFLTVLECQTIDVGTEMFCAFFTDHYLFAQACAGTNMFSPPASCGDLSYIHMDYIILARLPVCLPM